MSRLPLRARARRAARLGLPVLTLAPAALLALPAGPAHAASHTRAFNGVGCGGTFAGMPANADNVFAVPDGVTSLDVVLQGQKGAGADGGRPAELRATNVPVYDGVTSFYLCVGVGGGSSGGNGGGGLSQISYNANNSSPMFVAGGGGGAGSGGVGSAGGSAGVSFGNGGSGVTVGTAGGGSGAYGSGGGNGGANTAGSQLAGGPGNGRFGGPGGSSSGAGGAGGGGGAGLYSGGGGAAGDNADGGAPGAGGGGGFSYCVTTCSALTVLDTFGPYVTITYKDPSTTTLTAPTTTQGELYTYTATVSPAPGDGTVAFTRDGTPIEDCESVPVESDGRAVCRKQARDAGTVEVGATFSGTEGFGRSSDAVDHTTLTSSFTATPAPLAFGEVAVGGWTTRVLTVTNTGEADLRFEGTWGILLGDYHPEDVQNTTDFSVAADGCTGRTLPAGQTCDVTIRFTPQARGDQHAQIVVRTDAFSGPGPVRLDGTGVVASLTVTPSPVDFGQVRLGTTASREVTVTNGGDSAIEIGSIAGVRIGGYVVASPVPNTTDFSLGADSCSGRTLAPGAHCTVTIVFTPTVAGERTGRLTVDSDDAVMHAPVRLTGVGVIAPEPRTEPQPETRTPPAPAGRGAVLAPSARRGVSVSQDGGVRLPLQCPAAQPCSAAGELTLTVAGSSPTGARAAAAKTKVLLRFKGVKIAAGKARTLSLRLPAAFVKAQQKKGVRKLVTTLTIRTTLGSGRTITTRQKVTLLIPRAAAKPKPAQRPSFTG